MIRHYLAIVEAAIIRLLLVGMTLLVFLEVILRFVFNTGWLWMEEVTLYLGAWFVLFGVSYGLKVGAHIGVDALVRLFPSGVRRWISVFAVLGCLFYCGVLLYGSWIYLGKLKLIGLTMEDVPLPKWQAMSILFGGFVLLALRLMSLLWMLFSRQVDGFELLDEAEESLALAQEETKSTPKESPEVRMSSDVSPIGSKL